MADHIDTRKEVVERLAKRINASCGCAFGGNAEQPVAGTLRALAAERDAQTARADAAEAEVARLTAELTALRAGQDALVAAAYEAAAEWLMTVPEKLPNRDQYAKHIRALTPSDATAALDAMLRAERNKVRREVAEAVEELCPHADIPGGNCIPDKFDEGTSAAYETILAMIEPEDQTNE